MLKEGDRIRIAKLWEGDTHPLYNDMEITLVEGMEGTLVYLGGEKYPYKIEFDTIVLPVWVSSRSTLEKIGEKKSKETLLDKICNKLNSWNNK